MKEKLLFTENLSVGYNRKPLIRDINIAGKRGQILTLIGPNGSGKSTILKSISRYLEPIYGTVYLDSVRLNQFSGRELAKRISVVWTEKIRPEWMSCEEIVAAGRYPYTGKLGILSAEDKKKVEEAIHLVHMEEFQQQDFMAVSDGQRQRVLLAKAICQEPELLILDEPTSFLDIHYKLELLQILRQMAEEKKLAVIVSLHELDLAQKISDYVICVKGEQILLQGKPEQIFKEEIIKELYGLTSGSYNPVFGSVEMKKPEGKAEVFVVAGGGSGVEQFRLLQRRGIPFYAGILHKGDVDYQVACSLTDLVISEKAFERIGEEAYQKALNCVRQCRYVICTVSEFGEMNRRNKTLVEEAERMGCKIFFSREESERFFDFREIDQ